MVTFHLDLLSPEVKQLEQRESKPWHDRFRFSFFVLNVHGKMIPQKIPGVVIHPLKQKHPISVPRFSMGFFFPPRLKNRSASKLSLEVGFGNTSKWRVVFLVGNKWLVNNPLNKALIPGEKMTGMGWNVNRALIFFFEEVFLSFTKGRIAWGKKKIL